MQFDGALSTAEPQCKALGILLDAGENTILWDDCRLIWDSASLVSSGTKSDEVRPPASRSLVVTNCGSTGLCVWC